MLLRLCGFGGHGDPNEIVCGEFIESGWNGYKELTDSRDFGNKYQGEGTHWVEDTEGKTYD